MGKLMRDHKNCLGEIKVFHNSFIRHKVKIYTQSIQNL